MLDTGLQVSEVDKDIKAILTYIEMVEEKRVRRSPNPLYG
jgi:hypothetical protein